MLKIATDFSDDVHFFHAYYFKFTINANMLNIPVEITRALIIAINIFNENGISLSLLCPDSDPSYAVLTERTSDNQLWATLVRNDLAQVAMHPIVKIFRT